MTLQYPLCAFSLFKMIGCDQKKDLIVILSRFLCLSQNSVQEQAKIKKKVKTKEYICCCLALKLALHSLISSGNISDYGEYDLTWKQVKYVDREGIWS